MRTFEEMAKDLEALRQAYPEEAKRLTADLKEACQLKPRYEQALREAARISADLLNECNRADAREGEPDRVQPAKFLQEMFLEKWKAHAGL